ncbi:hypothetical protein ACFJZ3_004423, partial [Vibrio vulnificus]|nr:hypothetical protein [Vibrio vulnificus]
LLHEREYLMIKVEYNLDGQSGELELSKLAGFESVENLLAVHGVERISNALANELLEEVLVVLKPEMSAVPQLSNSELNGERNLVTAQSQAQKFGFTKLLGHFEDKVIFVI